MRRMNDIMSWWRGRPPLRFATRTFAPVGLATNWPASGDDGLAASFQLRWNLYIYQPVICPTVGVHFNPCIDSLQYSGTTVGLFDSDHHK